MPLTPDFLLPAIGAAALGSRGECDFTVHVPKEHFEQFKQDHMWDVVETDAEYQFNFLKVHP